MKLPWRRLLIFAGIPCFVLVSLWGVQRAFDQEPRIELRHTGETTRRLSTTAAVAEAESRAGFRPSLARAMPAPGMRLRFIDTSGLDVTERYLDVNYSSPSLSVTVHESNEPKTPEGQPPQIGNIAGVTVWWSPFSEAQHFYVVRTETRFLVIQVDGEEMPAQENMLRMIESMVHP